MNDISIKLTDDQAWAFAEFLKRVLPEDFERRAADRTLQSHVGCRSRNSAVAC